MEFQPSPPPRRPDVVLCDAMGTLLRLDRPVERLRGSLSARGVTVSHEEAVAALSDEVRRYRLEHLTGTDPASVTALRRRCAEVFSQHVPGLGAERAYQVLMGMLRFQVIAGTQDALRRLRASGIRLAVVSNWDSSLEGVMLAVGLREHVDAVVASAAVGAAKPDPRPLARALELLGAAPEAAVMIGDDAVDTQAAHALGVPCLTVEPGEGIAAATDAILALPR